MKEIFERYKQQSLEVEKILEKSIATVRSGRSPSESFCDQIDTALRDLRSVYNEIAETLPKKASGAVAPEKASVKELEAIWLNVVNEKRHSIKAPLEEFICVYSDDSWYLEAIQERLEEAKKLLALMEENEEASPDVGSFLFFVECVKDDLDQNEKLAHTIEDKGIKGFSNRAIGGLLRGKYYIREGSASEKTIVGQAVEPGKTVANNVSDESIEQEVPTKSDDLNELEESNEPVETIEISENTAITGELKKGIPDSVTITIKNDTQELAPKSSKFINKARDHRNAMTNCLNYMMLRHMISYQHVNESTDSSLILNKTDIGYLVSQGYIGTICIKENGIEKEYYAPSSKACAYFKKSDVANYVKLRIPAREDYPSADLLKPLSSWDSLFIYRCKLIVDYLDALKEKYIIRISRGNPVDNFAYCNYFCVKGKPRTVATVRLSEDDYLSELKIIADYVEIEDDSLLLLVEDLKEIEAFCNRLSEKYPNAKEKIKFALVNDTEHIYDCRGHIIEETEGQSGNEGIERDAEPDEGDLPESEAAEEETQEIDATKDALVNVEDHPDEKKSISNSSDENDSLLSEQTVNEEVNEEITEQVQDAIIVTNEPENDLQEEKSIEFDYYRKALVSFGKDMPHVGMTILHMLAQEYPDMMIHAERFGYALGDPLLERDNRYQYLQSAFCEPFGQKFAYDALAFAAYLRLYFSPTALIDSFSIGNTDYLENNLMLEESNAAKSLCYKLSQFAFKHGQGIDDSLLGKVINHKDREQQLSEFSSQARLWKREKSKCFWTKVSTVYKKIIEDDGDLNKSLTIVAENRKEDLLTVKTFIDQYYHDDGVDYDALKELIQSTRREVDSMVSIGKDDHVQFVSRLISYDGKVLDSCKLGDEIILGDTVEICNRAFRDLAQVKNLYRFIDNDGNEYWTPVFQNDGK